MINFHRFLFGNVKKHQLVILEIQIGWISHPTEPLNAPKYPHVNCARSPHRTNHPNIKRSPKRMLQSPLHNVSRRNLTLHDWMTVPQFIDEHSTMSQQAIVKHFKTRAEGALRFTLSLAKRLRQYRIHLNQEQVQKAKQTRLDHFF